LPFLLAPSLLALVASASVACTHTTAEHDTDANRGSVHAFVTVTRTDQGDAPRAEAVAGFAQVPAAVDSERVLALVGFHRDIPEPGRCVSTSREADAALSPIDRVELLDAGDVVVSAGAASTRLAPNAFPTVTDLISGVLYTSRDRSAEPLPADADYAVQVTGGVGLPAVSVESRAPLPLAEVELDGVALRSATSIATRAGVEVTWGPGKPGDAVYVELATAEGGARTLCAFRDDDGVGIVPPEVFAALRQQAPETQGRPTQGGHVTVHRVRSTPFNSEGIDRGELRFDFAVESAAIAWE
jgi:hypothetical protein